MCVVAFTNVLIWQSEVWSECNSGLSIIRAIIERDLKVPLGPLKVYQEELCSTKIMNPSNLLPYFFLFKGLKLHGNSKFVFICREQLINNKIEDFEILPSKQNRLFSFACKRLLCPLWFQACWWGRKGPFRTNPVAKMR